MANTNTAPAAPANMVQWYLVTRCGWGLTSDGAALTLHAPAGAPRNGYAQEEDAHAWADAQPAQQGPAYQARHEAAAAACPSCGCPSCRSRFDCSRA